MLVSHRKHFIFTKSLKTAGTSVESYFERYCMPDGEWQESHGRDEYVSEAGIIGCRRPNVSGSIWYNHMSARRIRDLISQDIWDRYFKFTVVRNPFDKLISGFYFFENDKQNYSYTQRLKAFARQILDRGNPIDRVEGKTEIERFRCWIQKGGEIIDRDKYLIDGQECVDYFIRFENLHEGMKHVCDRLSIPFEPSRIPEFKKGIRHDRIQVRDYYDHETVQIVQKIYSWELERFGYDLPKEHIVEQSAAASC
ncbi:MAG: sulfotransferase family protein [Betaproteobacteria bacterium]|nr:sulfotransferase family protein [Gammaproteobacteria bacterium]MDH3436609.1 sulfotransferase family protein [Betaproteobacteria bacterium]